MAQRIREGARGSLADKHRSGPEISAAQGPEIQMTTRCRIGIEEDLESAVEHESFRRPPRDDTPAGSKRRLEQNEIFPGRGQNFGAGQSGQTRADDE